MYHREIAIKIINEVRFFNSKYNVEQLLKELKLESESDRKKFFCTLEVLIANNQIKVVGERQTLIRTEKSLQVLEEPCMRFLRSITNNQTFAAALGAAIGVNLGNILHWIVQLAQ